jgi:hypothetical protein
MDKRIQELLECAEAEGLPLPMSPEAIIELEDAGHIVDLKTGAIVLGEANQNYRYELTPYGEAMVHLMHLGLEV